jgi:hypothetical protein
MSPPASLCPSCTAPIRREDVHAATGQATCHNCGAQMNLDVHSATGATTVQRRLPVALPKGLNCEKTIHGIQITRTWFTPAAIVLLLFCVFWNGFLLFEYWISPNPRMPGITQWVPILHVLIGVYLGYFAVASLVNRTHVSVDRGMLQIRHTPLPWPGSRKLGAAQIRQLYCKRHVTRNRNGPRFSWQLWAVTDASTHHRLLSRLQHEQALYLEQELEKALGLQPEK